MSNKFDLEQQIMNCWNVVEDIRTLNETFQNSKMSEDQVANYLLGLETIYEVKFEKLFNLYEKMVSRREIKWKTQFGIVIAG